MPICNLLIHYIYFNLSALYDACYKMIQISVSIVQVNGYWNPWFRATPTIWTWSSLIGPERFSETRRGRVLQHTASVYLRVTVLTKKIDFQFLRGNKVFMPYKAFWGLEKLAKGPSCSPFQPFQPVTAMCRCLLNQTKPAVLTILLPLAAILCSWVSIWRMHVWVLVVCCCIFHS